MLTTIPVSAHVDEPPSPTHCSFILSNVTNIFDFNASILNQKIEDTVDPSISSNITHISDSYASLLTESHENPNYSSISLNASHNIKYYESLSTQNQESVAFSEVGHNSSIDVSFSNIPDSQMDSFCKSSDILSESFVNNLLLDSGKKNSDDPTYVSSVVVSDVPPPVAVDLPAILNHTGLPDSENVEENPTCLLSSDNVEPLPITADLPTTLNHARPLDPKNIEKNYTCLLTR